MSEILLIFVVCLIPIFSLFIIIIIRLKESNKILKRDNFQLNRELHPDKWAEEKEKELGEIPR